MCSFNVDWRPRITGDLGCCAHLICSGAGPEPRMNGVSACHVKSPPPFPCTPLGHRQNADQPTVLLFIFLFQKFQCRGPGSAGVFTGRGT